MTDPTYAELVARVAALEARLSEIERQLRPQIDGTMDATMDHAQLQMAKAEKK
jgi:hypothetical protein